MRRVLLCLSVLLWASPSQAAMAYIKSTVTTSASGTTHAWTHTAATAGSLLRACARLGSETITLTIADNKSNVWALEQGPIDHANGGVTVRGYCWYAVNIAAGDTIITVTSSATTQCRCTSDEYSGADTVDPFDVATSSNNILTSTTPSLSHTPTAAGPGMVMGAFLGGGNCTFTAGTGYTAHTTGDAIKTEEKAYSGTGAITVDGTCSTAQHWIVLAATYTAPAAAATTRPQVIGGVGVF
jgi:hypothetical protein